MKKDLVSKRKLELKNLENSQPIHIAKNREICSEKKSKSVADQPFDKDVDVIHGLNYHLNRSQEKRRNITCLNRRKQRKRNAMKESYEVTLSFKKREEGPKW